MKKILLIPALILISACTPADFLIETPRADVEQNETINTEVPFISQAPFAEWDDPIQQDACEEASVIMAMMWVEGVEKISKKDAKEAILKMAEFETSTYGFNKDTSSEDTLKRLINEYFEYNNAYLENISTKEKLIEILESNKIIIMPVNGKLLNNPNFTNGGPDKHMFVIKSYDKSTDEFITNDPGTRNGENYRYSSDTIMKALKNYRTTNSDDEFNEKAVIVVTR